MGRAGDSELLKCAFCGKSQEEVKTLVVRSPRACICDECVDLCDQIIHADILEEDPPESIALRLVERPTPLEIRS